MPTFASKGCIYEFSHINIEAKYCFSTVFSVFSSGLYLVLHINSDRQTLKTSVVFMIKKTLAPPKLVLCIYRRRKFDSVGCPSVHVFETYKNDHNWKIRLSCAGKRQKHPAVSAFTPAELHICGPTFFKLPRAEPQISDQRVRLPDYLILPDLGDKS